MPNDHSNRDASTTQTAPEDQHEPTSSGYKVCELYNLLLEMRQGYKPKEPGKSMHAMGLQEKRRSLSGCTDSWGDSR
jgi:hypothetical protein